MLFSSSLVALVGNGDRPAFSPRRLRLWNTKKDKTICEVNFHTAVLAVRLNRKRVVVCLREAMHVFDIADMKCLQTLETAPNPHGVVALSPNEDNCYLAFPDGLQSTETRAVGGRATGGGEVIFYDALTLKVLNKVLACRSRVVAVSFSRDGKLVATASEQGTVIRVFTVPAAVKICTLRRGSTSCDVYSMSFNKDSTRLAVSSSTRTIHIFDITAGAGGGGGGGGGGGVARGGSGKPGGTGGGTIWGGRSGQEGRLEQEGGRDGERASGEEGDGGLGGGLVTGLRTVVSLLPHRVTTRVSDIVDSSRSFASARLHASAGRSICALIPVPLGWAERGGGTGQDQGQGMGGNMQGEALLVVTDEGILYAYAVDTARGGECRLEKANTLLENSNLEMGAELFPAPPQHDPPPPSQAGGHRS
ncbi:unnamed protein product [Discosporangium mesarthrocarpum]